MFKTQIILAVRTLKKHAGTSFLNLAGLALGMGCVIFIALFVVNEISYDRHHENADRIFRLICDRAFSGPIIPAPPAPILHREIPEIETFARIYPVNVFGRSVVLSRDENQIFFSDFYFADPSLFDIFSFEFTAGDRLNPLRDSDSLVLTQTAAERLFGSNDPIGRRVSLDHHYEFKVSAVIKNIPRNSHFAVDGIVPLDFYGRLRNNPNWAATWGNSAFVSYLLLAPGTNIAALETKINAVLTRHLPPDRNLDLILQPLTDIHLHSHYFYELGANSDIRIIYIFAAIALLVLLTAGINYVNLSSARSLQRAREVGLRKVVGARRGQLVRQFLGESVLLSFLGLGSALALTVLLMPAFKALTGKSISMAPLVHKEALLALPAAALLLGAAAGAIPALLLSSFQPRLVLSNRMSTGRGGSAWLRKILVTVQFVISIALIAGSALLFKQMSFIRTKNLGFNPDQTVVFNSLRNQDAIEKMSLIAERFRGVSGVISASASSHTPGIPANYRYVGIPGQPAAEQVHALTLWTDPEFAKTYQLEFAAGRDFSREITTDRSSAYVLNETAVRALGWSSPEEAVGRRVNCNRRIGTVIGVTKDFHFHSLHSEIEPTILLYRKDRFYAVSARFSADNIRSTLGTLESVWGQVLPQVPFNTTFVDRQFAAQYREDRQVGRIMTVFTLLAVVISCLGLFGLAVFSTERRIKEIGVRKVLGASTAGLVVMLSREFTRWVALANLIAWPAAYLAMRKWLEGFAYRIEIGPGPFLLAGFLALGIALATVGYQSAKAAAADPIKALRYE